MGICSILGSPVFSGPGLQMGLITEGQTSEKFDEAVACQSSELDLSGRLNALLDTMIYSKLSI